MGWGDHTSHFGPPGVGANRPAILGRQGGGANSPAILGRQARPKWASVVLMKGVLVQKMIGLAPHP